MAILLQSCGSGPAAPPPAAQLQGDVISRAELRTYVQYSARFYAWAHHGLRISADDCSTTAKAPACAVLQRQVLARLIEERTVLAYASRHHISLSASERTRIQARTREMTTYHARGSNLLRSVGASQSFMQALVTRQVLIQKVQEKVSPSETKRGFSYHIRKFVVPGGTSPPAARQQALAIAIDGGPIPPQARVRSEWVASFRLDHPTRKALNSARVGEFVGPMARGDSFFVLQLLGKGRHRYGLPARHARMRVFFHRWIQRAVARVHPRCFEGTGREERCPGLAA